MRTLLLAVVAGLLTAPAPAYAAENHVFIEVNPHTVHAGGQVGVRASCGQEHGQQTAEARSRAFPDVTLHPQQGSTLLTGSATVRSDIRPGEYQVHLRCPSSSSASTKLQVTGGSATNRPTKGPATGGGGTAGGPPAAALLLAGGTAALALGGGLLLRRRPT